MVQVHVLARVWGFDPFFGTKLHQVNPIVSRKSECASRSNELILNTLPGMGETNNKRSTLPQLGLEAELPPCLSTMTDRAMAKSLSRALFNFLGGEEGIEYLGPYLHRNAPTRICNPYLHSRGTSGRLDPDLAFRSVAFLTAVSNCVGPHSR